MATAAKRKPAKKSTGNRTAAKKPSATTRTNGQADVCFVIMPFGGWLDSYYVSIYRPAIEAAGLDPHRADDLFRPSTIVNDIWSYTKKAKVLLADLTGKNPNVFYELGLAHALAKPAILIAESMDDIPFDLRALRIILYDKNAHDWGQLLGAKIESALREVLTSPVEAVLPAFLEVRGGNKASISQEQKDLIEIKQEMDLLRRSVAIRERAYLDSELRNGPEYAKELIARYTRRGMPPSFIVRRVVEEAGAPASWVERQLQEFLIRTSPKEAGNLQTTVEAATSIPVRNFSREEALQAALRAAGQVAKPSAIHAQAASPSRSQPSEPPPDEPRRPKSAARPPAGRKKTA